MGCRVSLRRLATCRCADFFCTAWRYSCVSLSCRVPVGWSIFLRRRVFVEPVLRKSVCVLSYRVVMVWLLASEPWACVWTEGSQNLIWLWMAFYIHNFCMVLADYFFVFLACLISSFSRRHVQLWIWTVRAALQWGCKFEIVDGKFLHDLLTLDFVYWKWCRY